MGQSQLQGERPTLWTVAWRGLKRRCPRCGRGPLFRKWFTLYDDCSVCGLAIQPKPGDTWGFWVVGDRIFVAGTMIALYLGFTPQEWIWRLTFLAAVVAFFFLTMPARMGLCVGLDYLSRRRWED